jgi:hypothetical protein
MGAVKPCDFVSSSQTRGHRTINRSIGSIAGDDVNGKRVMPLLTTSIHRKRVKHHLTQLAVPKGFQKRNKTFPSTMMRKASIFSLEQMGRSKVSPVR